MLCPPKEGVAMPTPPKSRVIVAQIAGGRAYFTEVIPLAPNVQSQEYSLGQLDQLRKVRDLSVPLRHLMMEALAVTGVVSVTVAHNMLMVKLRDDVDVDGQIIEIIERYLRELGIDPV